MNSIYRIIVLGSSLYKEIEILPNDDYIKLGTDIDCNVRLHKKYFFENIKIEFVKKNDCWSMICSDNLYFTSGNSKRMMSKRLEHGEHFEVRYQESCSLVFSIDFLIDFDNRVKNYERKIDISQHDFITIGNSPSDMIIIQSEYVKKDSIKLTKNKDIWVLTINATTYGIYHNGKKAGDGEIIKNNDFLSISDFFFYYKDNHLWTEVRSDIKIVGCKYSDHCIPYQYPKFSRNTRIKTVINDSKIEVLSPAPKPEKPKTNLLTRLLPSMGMLIAAGAMAFLGGAMVIMSAISGVMAIVTSVISIRESKKDYKQRVIDREEKYRSYAERKREEISRLRKEELCSLNEIYISQEDEKKRLFDFSQDLFDRRKDDEDYLHVRLGSGKVIAKREIEYKKQETLEISDELQQIPEQISEEYKFISDAPIVCNFKEINAIGIVGDESYRYMLMKNIVIDVIARHYHSDVKMFFVAEENHKDKIYWLRFLPNVYNDDINVRNIVCNDESKNLIFEYLYKELTLREQNKKYEADIIIFLYDEYGFKNHPVSKFVDKAKELGVTFVFFGKTRSDIPLGCSYIVDLKSNSMGILIDTQDKDKSVEFDYPGISDEIAFKIVNILAPIYTEEISLEGTLTKSITMFRLLNIISVDDMDVIGNWDKSQVFKTMSAPIGVSKTGVIRLDLHDKAHGPHGLVAGTTGSGKSEILQTYILSMSVLFHPYDVGFVIIDFKGGGMVNQFKKLPHLIGAITNIDGKEIDRSLKSIRAELQKRQRLFADADVNHIDKYIKKYKANEVTVPLPHLIIIVDEFAELKAEQPEFMKELISAARIGRSLGVHLILATQKPSGQVSEQIWSNSRFKLCLKVQSQEDSNEMLKSPLAAEIKEPGRAYLQVGNNEIFELFQSAYSGAPERSEDNNIKEFTVFEMKDTGKRVPVYVQKRKKGSTEKSVTQLDAIVNYVDQCFQNTKLKKLPDICLPSLSHSVDFPELSSPLMSKNIIKADIGIYDDPDNQYQGVYSIDLSNQNLMIIGSSQSGKTNLLQNIIRNLSSRYTPSEVSIYILDFASRVLKNFEKLNHVGGVVCASDDEKLKNLFKMLYEEIEIRKEKLILVGVSSFAAYKEAGKTDLPQIVVIIDNLTALRELYFQDDDELLSLCREGLSVGINVIIANSQTSGIGYKYLSNFSARLALFCNDSNEYSALFDHCREKLDNIPGRCIVEIDKEHYECQSYLAFNGEKEIDRVKKINAYISEKNSLNKGFFARNIPVIPSVFLQSYVTEQFRGYMQNKFSVVAGLDYGTVMPFILDFSTLGVLGITGREKSGKHNWIKYIVNMLDEHYSGQAQLYVIDGISKKLSCLKNKPNVTKYSILHEDSVSFITEIEQQLKSRYDALIAGDENIISKSTLLMMIIDNMDAVEAICNDKNASDAFKNIVGRYKNMNVCIIVSCVENTGISYSAPDMIKHLRDNRHFICFEDISNLKIFDVPLAIMRNYKKPISVGDCYYFKEATCIKVKTAVASNN